MADAWWTADPSARLVRRLGASPQELDVSRGRGRCPDIWALDNGDIAIVGRDLTDSYAASLPSGLTIGAGERLVIIPRVTFLSAAGDGLDA